MSEDGTPIGEGEARAEAQLDVEEVLRDRSLAIAFQPIVNLATRARIGFEALARFHGSEVVSPRLWFEQAARLGVLHDLEFLAADRALAQISLLPDEAFMAINLSPATAASRAIADRLEQVPADRVVLELSEHSAVSNYRQFSRSLDALRALGVRIALDDAGGSDVSLQHLADVHADIIKLDNSVTRGIDHDEERQAVAAAYGVLAARGGAVSLAEGVETEEELAMLIELGIEAGQGYLFGRPGLLTA